MRLLPSIDLPPYSPARRDPPGGVFLMLRCRVGGAIPAYPDENLKPQPIVHWRRPIAAGAVPMSEHDRAGFERIFEELKEEHCRALEAGDVEAMQRVQAKLAELMARDGKRS